MLRIQVTLIVLLAVALAGCSDSGSGGVVAVDRAAPGEPVAESMISFPPVPIAYAGKGELWGRELLADSRFTDYSTAPANSASTASGAWRAFPTEAATTSVSHHEIEEEPGAFMLSFAAASSAMYVTQTTVPLDISVSNAWLIGTMEARCTAPNELGLTVGFDHNGAPVTVGVPHPAEDAWRVVPCIVPLFDPHPGARITASVTKRGTTQSEAAVRHVSLKVVRERPEGAPAAGLIANGSFDDYAFAGSLYPWFVRHWGGTEGEAELIPEGTGYAVRLTQPPANGGVAVTQQVHGLTDADKGRTLVATVDGTASGKVELILAIRSTKGGQQLNEYSVLAMHPGDGAKQPVRASIKLPADQIPEAVFIDVYRKPVTQNAVSFDNVKVSLE